MRDQFEQEGRQARARACGTCTHPHARTGTGQRAQRTQERARKACNAHRNMHVRCAHRARDTRRDVRAACATCAWWHARCLCDRRARPAATCEHDARTGPMIPAAKCARQAHAACATCAWWLARWHCVACAVAGNGCAARKKIPFFKQKRDFLMQFRKKGVLTYTSQSSDTTIGATVDPDPDPGAQWKNLKIGARERSIHLCNNQNIHRMFRRNLKYGGSKATSTNTEKGLYVVEVELPLAPTQRYPAQDVPEPLKKCSPLGEDAGNFPVKPSDV
ncbi:hypothetical protein F511_36205 [Dorcoceras hygrometricum]|uniref:Uncharacterized protein n=1 Tax=Dorcoceras hygrometricum TaxID=472368 RepID=A0A2Z7CTP1_9LAMI|nr:hypothetical protein F511_36205 [Dorcoceras hygrometricum]